MVSSHSTATIPKRVISTSQPTVISQCSPWLTPLVYLLGQRLVIPGYFGEICVTGQQNLPAEGPVILAPTHRSRWDAILLALVTGRPITGRDLRFMVTSTEVQGFQGCLIRRLGGFAINLSKPEIASLRHGIELLRGREMMVIFPEGGIFREPLVQPLKSGLARLAIQAESIQPGLGVQIVPISLQYTQPCPGWGCGVTINIGHPLAPSRYQQGSVKQRAHSLTADLKTSLVNLAN